MRRLLIACVIASSLCGRGAAVFAQAAAPQVGTDQPAPPLHGHVTRRRPAVAPATTPSTQNAWSDLVHGSAAQRALERSDNDIATRKPIDHSKDAFFSDWKGLK